MGVPTWLPHPEDGMFQRVLPARWQEAFTAYLGEYERHLPLCAAFPGVTAALVSLRARGIPRALVTGKSRPTALMSLKQFGLDGLFEPVETGSPSGVVKAAAIARVVSAWGACALHRRRRLPRVAGGPGHLLTT